MSLIFAGSISMDSTFNHLTTAVNKNVPYCRWYCFCITDLKKRIESLIDRDYIERDKDNSNQYIYVA